MPHLQLSGKSKDCTICCFISTFTFATTGFPGFLFDSSSQLKITILCVGTAAFTLIPLLILQRHSDTVQSTFTERLCHNTRFRWAESTLLGRTRSKPEPVLALCLHLTVFASHLGHYQRRAETGIQSTDQSAALVHQHKQAPPGLGNFLSLFMKKPTTLKHVEIISSL